MKNIFLKARKYIMLYLVAVLLGFLMLMIAFCIPTNPLIYNHMVESADTFAEENTWPSFDELSTWKVSKQLNKLLINSVDTNGFFYQNVVKELHLDNFTDAIILMSSAYDGTESLVDKCLQAYYPDSSIRLPDEVLIEYYRNQQVDKIRFSQVNVGTILIFLIQCLFSLFIGTLTV